MKDCQNNQSPKKPKNNKNNKYMERMMEIQNKCETSAKPKGESSK